MPRNANGVYSLPAGNPVVPGTLIETTWANPTMSDIAAALTASLPRDGSAAMTGDLRLNGAPPATNQSAVSKAYVDSFMVYATGMPIGCVTAFAGNVPPAGFLECNGQAVSRTTYAGLFAVLSTIYGAGDGVSTFNVPDMRDEFIRGKNATRAVGNKQPASFASHTHALSVSDPGHAHGASQGAHAHGITTGSHSHGVNDPGHVHGSGFPNNPSLSASGGASAGAWQGPTDAAGTGISIQAAGNLGGNTDTQQPTVTVGGAYTGISATAGVAGGAETVPQNIAQIYVIKAVEDAPAISTIVGLTSSDTQMIDIGLANPAIPELLIQSNVAFGTVKLDASGQIPLGLLPSVSQQFLGYWDASGGQTPSQAYPATNYASGDTYVISVTGTLTVYDPVTLVASPTVVDVGSLLQYIENSVTNPTGWYYVVSSSTVTAGQVSYIPTGSISSNNVQGAIDEVDSDLTALTGTVSGQATDITNLQTGKVGQTSQTGAAIIPAGNDAARPPGVNGYFRYNSQQNVFEGYTPNGWVQIAAADAGPAFSARRTSTLAASDNVWSQITGMVEDFDTGNAFNGTTFQPTVAGYYQINGCVDCNGVALTISGAGIYKNGVQGGVSYIASPSTVQLVMAVSDLVFLNGSTDYVDLRGFINGSSGLAFGTITKFSGSLVRKA